LTAARSGAGALAQSSASFHPSAPAHLVADRLASTIDRPPPLPAAWNPLGRGELPFDLAPLGMGREQLADVSETPPKPVARLGRCRRRRVERGEWNRLGAQTAGDREQLVEARALEHAPPRVRARGVGAQLTGPTRATPRRRLAPARLVGLGKRESAASIGRAPAASPRTRVVPVGAVEPPMPRDAPAAAADVTPRPLDVFARSARRRIRIRSSLMTLIVASRPAPQASQRWKDASSAPPCW
jgi:hypothetical protein